MRWHNLILTTVRASAGWAALAAALFYDGRTEPLLYVLIAGFMFYEIYAANRRNGFPLETGITLFNAAPADEFTGIVCSHVQTNDKLRHEVTSLVGYGAGHDALYGWFKAATHKKVVRDAHEELMLAGLRRVDWRQVVKSVNAGPDWTALGKK